MKLSLLDRLLATEVLGIFGFGVALFTTILVAMEELQPLTSMVVEHGVPVLTVGKIFILSLPYFIAFAFPMSMLLSTLLAFGRLSSESEITALLAAGVSPFRMAIPVATIGVIVGLVAISFNEFVSPAATKTKNDLWEAAVSSGVPNNRPFEYPKVVDGKTRFSLRADGYDGLTHRLVRPTMLFYDETGRPIGLEWAQEGEWQGGFSWTLRHGFSQQISPDPKTYEPKLIFDEQTTTIGVSLDQLLTATQDPNALTYRQLRARVNKKIRDHSTPVDINTDLVILYAKIAIPMASVIFALIGFPLGIRRPRSGNATGFALSIAIIFLYYLIYQYASILGNNGAIPPLVSAWLPDVLGLITAGILLRGVSRW